MRTLLTALGLALVVIVAHSSAAPAPQIPDKFTNLQILPKDITRQQLTPLMVSFSLGTGLRCEGCHLGEGNDLSKFDFASDARPAKAIARKMLKMMNTINGDLLKDVGDPARQPKVTCFTCHRGEKTPVTVAPRGGGPFQP